jgi:hypothetical protein
VRRRLHASSDRLRMELVARSLQLPLVRRYGERICSECVTVLRGDVNVQSRELLSIGRYGAVGCWRLDETCQTPRVRVQIRKNAQTAAPRERRSKKVGHPTLRSPTLMGRPSARRSSRTLRNVRLELAKHPPADIDWTA